MAASTAFSLESPFHSLLWNGRSAQVTNEPTNTSTPDRTIGSHSSETKVIVPLRTGLDEGGAPCLPRQAAVEPRPRRHSLENAPVAPPRHRPGTPLAQLLSFGPHSDAAPRVRPVLHTNSHFNLQGRRGHDGDARPARVETEHTDREGDPGAAPRGAGAPSADARPRGGLGFGPSRARRAHPALRDRGGAGVVRSLPAPAGTAPAAGAGRRPAGGPAGLSPQRAPAERGDDRADLRHRSARRGGADRDHRRPHRALRPGILRLRPEARARPLRPVRIDVLPPAPRSR